MAEKPLEAGGLTSHAGEPLVVIPARGGSKRIPRKNIRLFHGAPIIAWSIAAARQMAEARVVVSTDDDEIAEIARAYGAETPFQREPRLSDDHAGTFEVIADAVARLAPPPTTRVACLYPTAPFVDAQRLAEGLRALEETGAAFAFPVFEAPFPLRRAYEIEAGRLRPIDPPSMPKRSQDLPPAYFDSGQFYWARAETWARTDRRIWDDAAPVIVSADTVQDIDTEADWARAEEIFALRCDGRPRPEPLKALS